MSHPNPLCPVHDTDETLLGCPCNDFEADLYRQIPWVPYTNMSLRMVALCEETGQKATDDGRCPTHGGDACLYVYKHPYDNAIDRWKKAEQWSRAGGSES